MIGTLAARADGPVDVVTGDRDLFQVVDDERQIRVIYTVRGLTKLDVVDEADHRPLPDPGPGLRGLRGAARRPERRAARRARGRGQDRGVADPLVRLPGRHPGRAGQVRGVDPGRAPGEAGGEPGLPDRRRARGPGGHRRAIAPGGRDLPSSPAERPRWRSWGSAGVWARRCTVCATRWPSASQGGPRLQDPDRDQAGVVLGIGRLQARNAAAMARPGSPTPRTAAHSVASPSSSGRSRRSIRPSL